jgi:cytochrome c553
MYQRNVFLFATLVGLTLLSAGASADAQAKAAACAACHGADGNSINPIWPSLAGQGSNYIVAQIKAYKSGQRQNPSMSPMALSVADADLKVLGDYYAGLIPTIAPIGDADFAAAEKLYRGGDAERGLPACMACHGPNGAGNAPASFPALRGQHPEYTALQLKAYRDGTRATDAQNVMRDIAAKMSDEEIEILAHYVSALH